MVRYGTVRAAGFVPKDMVKWNTDVLSRVCVCVSVYGMTMADENENKILFLGVVCFVSDLYRTLPCDVNGCSDPRYVIRAMGWYGMEVVSHRSAVQCSVVSAVQCSAV